jgi:hypothetical protein
MPTIDTESESFKGSAVAFRVAAAPAAAAMLMSLGCAGHASNPSAGSTASAGSSHSEVPAIGAPCVIGEETKHGFAGFAVEEYASNLDARSCGGNICLAHHFQGRVSCPYGQTADDVQNLPADDPARCRTTDSLGNVTLNPVTVEVEPQLVDRPAAKTVFCTCGCSGTDPNAAYCSCPSGMQCEILFPGTATSGLCVRLDAKYDRAHVSDKVCSRMSTDPTTDCGNDRRNP